MEMVLVIVIIGILAGVATIKLATSTDTVRYESTKAEMRAIARAILGAAEPGVPDDAGFGYVGDIGALPPDVNALIFNTTGYATWRGPYLDTAMGSSQARRDAWEAEYVIMDMLIRSSGSGTNIDLVFVSGSGSLLNNSITGNVRSADGRPPGETYRDSFMVSLEFPDGSGGMNQATVNPDAFGYFAFNDIPIGRHRLQAIFIPDNDTLTYTVTIVPGTVAEIDAAFPADLW